MKHLDLFSGIGGFHLAGEMIWGDDFKTIAHIEIDKFCQKILRKHWPEVQIISDIKEYKHDGTNIDLLTGGFPCQPFSVAGKQRGKEDDRYLWPEMLRVISEVRPSWIIGENVAGIINMGLDQVLSDLENEGYEIQPFIIPACAQNAPHRRDRVWIVANHISKRRYAAKPFTRIFQYENGKSITTDENKNASSFNRFNGNNAGHDSGKVSQFKKTEACGLRAASNTKSGQPRKSTKRERWPNISRGNKQVASKSSNQRLQRCKWGKTYEKRQTAHGSVTKCNNAWNEPWFKVATRLCRMDDGISRKMDRTNRLKALGNAIVPQVVVPIMEAIKAINIKTKNIP